MNDLIKYRILITGACGTIGKGLIQYLLDNKKDCEILCLDNNESELFYLEQSYLDEARVNVFIADIRDNDRLLELMKGIDVVYHAAAYKHVIICERSPMDAVQTNIHGVNNIIRCAIESGVKKVIFTSSDKAVNPTNVMGTSKLMGERLITAANAKYASGNTVFASTRFGNVLGSNGSVLPIFKKQIENGGPITLTHPEMTRFVMSISQAVRLVVESTDLARGGEVFITKMPVIRIKDLAKVMINELAIKYYRRPEDIDIIDIGSKPGEKLYEELMSDEETRRAVELQDFFAVLPAFRGIYKDIDYNYKDKVNDYVDNPYISDREKYLSEKELKEFLYLYDLI